MRQTFEGRTLEEAEQKYADFKSSHPNINAKKLPPVELRMRSGAHVYKSEVKPTRVCITVDYEEQSEKKPGDDERQRAAESQREWRGWYGPLESESSPYDSILTLPG